MTFRSTFSLSLMFKTLLTSVLDNKQHVQDISMYRRLAYYLMLDTVDHGC